MIQLLGLRKFTDPVSNKEIKTDAFFERNWRAPTVADVFQNPETYLKAIDPEERYNIFFTQASCGAGKREFKEQWVIAFDMDECDKNRASEYIQIFLRELLLPHQAVGALWSGHGIHLAVNLLTPLALADFKKYRLHYQKICARLENAVRDAGLRLKCVDPQFFAPGMSFRLPGSWNQKDGREPVRVELLQSMLGVANWDWAFLSGLPVLGEGDALEGKNWKPDPQGVLEGCDFLKWCKQDPGRVNEAQWYALLSVIGRLPGGEKLAHEYSQGHPGYSEHETDQKLKQAMSHSGPRTCQGINSLWGECHKCPHFEKVNSPISVRGPDYIATQDTGFHFMGVDSKGNAKRGKPDFEGLRRYFEKEHPYKVMEESNMVHAWRGTHYEFVSPHFLRTFAEKHFHECDSFKRNEFVGKITHHNVIQPAWFNDTTYKKINFQNGVFDLQKEQLLPHSRELGFRYVLPYAFDPHAQAPIFEKFLDDITCGDKDLAQLLMEYVAYAFSGDDCWAKKCLLLTGGGDNGKSTFADLLKALAGKSNYSTVKMSEIGKDTIRVAMDGKLFNISEETPTRALMDSSEFKDIIAGGEIRYRSLFNQSYTNVNRTKGFILTNHDLESLDTSDAFYERFLKVPFNASFKFEKGNRDPRIKQKLVAELPGIFNLILRAYRNLMARGNFKSSETSRKAWEEFRKDSDSVRRWVGENLKVHPLNGGQKWTCIRVAFMDYARDMDDSKIRPENAITFGKKLAKLIPDYTERVTEKKIDGKTRSVLLDVVQEGSSEF